MNEYDNIQLENQIQEVFGLESDAIPDLVKYNFQLLFIFIKNLYNVYLLYSVYINIEICLVI